MTETIEQFAQYRKQARKFMTVREIDRKDYIPLGLCGEAGEVCDKVKKIIRDTDFHVDRPTTWSEQVTSDIMFELGDVCWYVAAMADYYHIDNNKINEQFAGFNLELYKSVPSTKKYALCISYWCNKLSGSDSIPDTTEAISQIIFIITMFARHLDSEIYDIFRMNIAKLTSRQNRNKIQGSGDHR